MPKILGVSRGAHVLHGADPRRQLRDADDPRL